MADHKPVEFEPDLVMQDFSFNALLMGPPKTGKTAGAASAPGPVFYGNTEVEQRLRYARIKYGEKLKVKNLKGFQDCIDAYYAVQSGDYGTFVLDSVAELYGKLLRELASKNTGAMKNKPTQQQYGEVTDRIEWFAKSMIEQAGLNTVLLCHDIPIKNEMTGEVEHLPFSGSTGTGGLKLSRKLLGMVDVIGYTGVIVDAETGAKEYVAQLVPGHGRPCGDGFDCLADERGLRAVDLTEWIDHIVEVQAGLAEEMAAETTKTEEVQEGV